MTSLEPSSTSFTWNFVRCACILAFLFIPADILGCVMYNFYYPLDFAYMCITVYFAMLLAIIGGLWFAYFDLKYARLYEIYKLKENKD